MEFDEVSLVTRGANQLAKVVLFKADGCSCDKPMGKKGKACKECGGMIEKSQSFIEKVAAILKNAGVEDTDAATVLDSLEEAVHDNDDPGDTLLDDEDPATKENAMAEQTEAPDLSGLPDDIRKSVEGHIAALTGTNAELTKDNTELAEALDAALTEEDVTEEVEGETDVTKMADDEIAKLDPLMQSIVKQAKIDRAAAEEATTIAKAERDLRETAEMTELAKGMTENVGTDTALLATAMLDIKKNCLEATLAIVEQTIRSANEIAKKGLAPSGGNGTDVVSKSAGETALESAATELCKADTTLTREAAMLAAAKADPKAYAEHVTITRKG